MKKKVISCISFLFVSLCLFSTVAMANQSGSEDYMQAQRQEELAAKILGRTPYSIRQLVSRGLSVEELLIAEGKYDVYRQEMQRLYGENGNKDKSIIVEMGDHNEREGGMLVRIIAALDETTEDMVKVELTGLKDNAAGTEKTKSVILDSKKGKVDIYVIDSDNQNAMNEHQGMAGNYQGLSNDPNNKNSLGMQGASGYQTGYTNNIGGTTGAAGYQGTATGGGATGRGATVTGDTNNFRTGGTPGTGATGAAGYTTGTTRGNTAGTTGYTGAAGTSGTGTLSPMTGAGNTGGGAFQGRGMGMTQTVDAMDTPNETYYPTEARLLGISQTELKTAIDSGNTIYSMMSSTGKLKDYKDALITENRAAFNKGVNEGKFDNETADKMREYFERKIAAWDGTTPIDLLKIKVG